MSQESANESQSIAHARFDAASARGAREGDAYRRRLPWSTTIWRPLRTDLGGDPSISTEYSRPAGGTDRSSKPTFVARSKWLANSVGECFTLANAPSHRQSLQSQASGPSLEFTGVVTDSPRGVCSCRQHVHFFGASVDSTQVVSEAARHRMGHHSNEVTMQSVRNPRSIVN